MGCIDMNAWRSRVDRPDRPDWVMFDLDPSEDVGFAEVVEVALLVKQTLDLARARELPEDERLARHPRARPDRAPARLRADARVRGHRRRRARAGASRARHDGVDEGEAPRRARRREPERRRARRRRPSTPCGRAPGAPVSTPLAGTRSTRGSTRRVHDGRRARPGRPARRPLRARADAASVARRPRSRRSARSAGAERAAEPRSSPSISTRTGQRHSSRSRRTSWCGTWLDRARLISLDSVSR